MNEREAVTVAQWKRGHRISEASSQVPNLRDLPRGGGEWGGWGTHVLLETLLRVDSMCSTGVLLHNF